MKGKVWEIYLYVTNNLYTELWKNWL